MTRVAVLELAEKAKANAMQAVVFKNLGPVLNGPSYPFDKRGLGVG
jgi:hypothetical protein